MRLGPHGAIKLGEEANNEGELLVSEAFWFPFVVRVAKSRKNQSERDLVQRSRPTWEPHWLLSDDHLDFSLV